jgi:cyclic pyranopterin phosphate synthase
MNPVIDPFGRAITYLRVSVTDRCDLRCVYCMAEDMTFLPRAEILSLEEIERLATVFIGLGVRKLRITGGEPLVRRNVISLFAGLGTYLGNGLDELTLTTNGTQLARHAAALADVGVRRINVSLDTLDPGRFAGITRWGRIETVLEGLRAAQQAGLAVKINTVALRGENEDEIPHMLAWCGEQGFDLCLIETMPLGEIEALRADQYLPLSLVRSRLRQRFTLDETDYRTGGPARYFDVRETGTRVGFITPMTHNFCESCNRVRLTVTGTLFLCLGQNDSADLRRVLRSGASDAELEEAVRAAIARKPKGHDFVIDRRQSAPAVTRHMSVTGG